MTASNIRQVRLSWAGDDLLFEGGPDGGPAIFVDSKSEKGPSPMELLLLSLAGCMAIDVKMILEKSRVPLESLEVEAVGVRADEAPKRYRTVELVYRLGGPGEADQAKLDRAIQLSRDKYCSVLHTLDPGLDLSIRVEAV